MENTDYTLLVVDDVEENRDMLSRRLQRRGFNVLTADGGKSALDRIAAEPIDLVLLDIMMPDVDGIEVLRQVRENYDQAALPVIMQTAKSDATDVVEALDLGANDYVTKPINFPVVLARVQSHLRSKVAAVTTRLSDEPGPGELGPGVVLAGKYRIEEPIGEGTFGAVYRARHVDLDDDVAVKVLQKNVTAGESLERFRREGVSACRIKHPNAVAVSDFGVSERGVAYLVMEFLRGEPLSDVLKKDGAMAPRRVNEILQPVLDVLAEAHEGDLVHRDIKPENIFLQDTPRGEVVKVLDFGIAKLAGDTVAQENLTAEGFVLGTPAYIAPERLTGHPYDGRSDVYSTGIMIFYMLTGRLPYVVRGGDAMSLLMQHVHDEMPRMADVLGEAPGVLEEVIASATAKNAPERPDARSLANRLQAAVEALKSADAPLTNHRATTITVDQDAPTIATAAAALAEEEATEAVDSGQPFLGKLFGKLRGKSS